MPDGTVQSTLQSRNAISVRYDAATQSYTVETADISQTFAPSDALATSYGGEQVFGKTTSFGNEYLTLVTNPYYGAEFSNRYVGMGYWQQNRFSADGQQTLFTTFTYGFPAPGTGIPRTGSAHWLTDIFGLLSTPGSEVRIVQGLGDFAVDFDDASFRASAYLNENDIVTSGGAGGSLEFNAGGSLTSGNGFSGNFSYRGSAAIVQVFGALNGWLYGPNGEEIGATFNGSGNGVTLTGGFTGQQFPVGSTSDGMRNISLTNPIVEQRLYDSTVSLFWREEEGTSELMNLISGRSVGSVTISPWGKREVITNHGGYEPNPGDLVPTGAAHLATYQTSVGERDMTVTLYKVGGSNSELALTYASFVGMVTREPTVLPTGDMGTNSTTQYLAYGLATPPALMAGRTGSATYSGIVYGSGASPAGALYDITGTSRFDFRFDTDTYDGWLQLAGQTPSGATTDFGRWTFASTIYDGSPLSASLIGPDAYSEASYIIPKFYGPNGQELGAIFWLQNSPELDPTGTQIIGVTVAKEQ